jgi:hypothetical protein
MGAKHKGPAAQAPLRSINVRACLALHKGPHVGWLRVRTDDGQASLHGRQRRVDVHRSAASIAAIVRDDRYVLR